MPPAEPPPPPAGSEGSGNPHHEYATAWELEPEVEEIDLRDKPEDPSVEGSDEPARTAPAASAPAGDRFDVPWAMPED